MEFASVCIRIITWCASSAWLKRLLGVRGASDYQLLCLLKQRAFEFMVKNNLLAPYTH